MTRNEGRGMQGTNHEPRVIRYYEEREKRLVAALRAHEYAMQQALTYLPNQSVVHKLVYMRLTDVDARALLKEMDGTK